MWLVFISYSAWVLRNAIQAYPQGRFEVERTCSMHGEKEQTLVTRSFFRALLAWTMASQGAGMSRKTASAASSKSKPLERTSRCFAVTQPSIPWTRNSSRALRRRSSWKSNVWRWPFGATARMRAWLSEALPVPLSTTTDPGFNSNCVITMLIRGNRGWLRSSESRLTTTKVRGGLEMRSLPHKIVHHGPFPIRKDGDEYIRITQSMGQILDFNHRFPDRGGNYIFP